MLQEEEYASVGARHRGIPASSASNVAGRAQGGPAAPAYTMPVPAPVPALVSGPPVPTGAAPFPVDPSRRRDAESRDVAGAFYGDSPVSDDDNSDSNDNEDEVPEPHDRLAALLSSMARTHASMRGRGRGRGGHGSESEAMRRMLAVHRQMHSIERDLHHLRAQFHHRGGGHSGMRHGARGDFAEFLRHLQPVNVSLSAEQIEMLPVSKVTARFVEQASDDNKSCPVCLCEYEEGDDRMLLPCMHGFHAPCIRKWLEQNVKCPVCKADVREGFSS